jgi:hypothetical protein
MSSQNPRRETAGGFSLLSSGSTEQNVLAQRQQLLVRYYLWTADGPWRLPNRLHYDLIDRKAALPHYALFRTMYRGLPDFESGTNSVDAF